MDRRSALLAITMSPLAAQNPYYPTQNKTPWITIDLSTMEQLTIRMPEGMVTYSSKELWNAIKK